MTGKGLFRDRPGRPDPPTLFRTSLGRSEARGAEPRSPSTSCAGSDRTGAEQLAADQRRVDSQRLAYLDQTFVQRVQAGAMM